MDQAKLTQWARDTANDIRGATRWTPGQLAAGVEFLRIVAPGSQFYLDAKKWVDTNPRSDATPVSVAQSLEAWADFADDGLIEEVGFEVGARVAAATDLMEQVQTLLDQGSGVHPAAAVMLAGAALEELLRSLVVEHEIEITGTHGMNKYSIGLRSAKVITPQDKKDIDFCAGLRNTAAHGGFEEITRNNAVLMSQHVNLLMASLRS